MNCEKQTTKCLLHPEALIAKIYFTKIPSSTQALHSFSLSADYWLSNFYRILLLALQKVWIVKITPQQIFINQFSSYLLNYIWKNMTCFIFPPQVVETTSTDFSVWLWTVTQFNTHKNELPLKMLLVLGNRLLISTWRYWI